MNRMDLLMQAQTCWQSWGEFRRDRVRNKRFTYGDQWSDLVEVDGVLRSEEEVLTGNGRMPLKNNLIRRLVRNVLGVFRDRYREPTCVARDPAESLDALTMEKLLRCNADVNRLAELYARTMEEFLISGLVVHKKWYGRKGSRTDCWTDFVQPDRFFLDISGRDFRGWDTGLVGQVHSLSPEVLLSSFASSPADVAKLRDIYGDPDTRIGGERHDVYEIWCRENVESYQCHDPVTGRCARVDADGYRQLVAPENRRRSRGGQPPLRTRWMLDEVWRWYFLAPDGEVLAHGDSPYRHGSHPYVFKAYPFIDGEIHSFVADIIDQQKFTNRLISMYDWILQSSAKGVLLLPEGCVPDDLRLQEIRDEWSRFNGVIVYKPTMSGKTPEQVTSNSADTGITDLLNIQTKMMEDISGVNGALQGKLDSGSMSGTLYNQQTRNSLTALSDLLMCFDDFIREAAVKDASNIGQFYSRSRIDSIAGADSRLALTRRFDCSRYDFKI